MERTEVEVVMVEQAGPIAKAGKSFYVPIVQVLANGERFKTQYGRSLKRDVVKYAATLPSAPDVPTFVIFHDGERVGERSRFYIGPRR